MADSSSTGYHTSHVPIQRDWYFHLRQRISTVRALIQPVNPDDPDQRPSFLTCNKGRLLRYISFIHTAIVSLPRFSIFPSSGLIFIQKGHADRNPDFLSDPLVIRFLGALAPMVLRLDEGTVPASWSLWFDREAAEANADVCMLHSIQFFILTVPPGRRRLRMARCFSISKGRRPRRTEGHFLPAIVLALTWPGSSSRRDPFCIVLFAQTSSASYGLS